jgi:hypothetical protein
VPQHEIAFNGEMQMKDDETDAGGDFFFDLMKTVIALFCFVLSVSLICAVVWGLIA